VVAAGVEASHHAPRGHHHAPWGRRVMVAPLGVVAVDAAAPRGVVAAPPRGGAALDVATSLCVDM
jgi:cytochrome c5